MTDTAVVGHVIKHVSGVDRVTGWAAVIGDEHLTDYNTKREAQAAVESRVGYPLTWIRDEAGRYRGVV